MNLRAAHAFLKMNQQQWRTLMLAIVLFFVQVFSQLHGLEHLDDSDHDGQSEELCVLCILASGLDSGYLPNIAANNYSNQPVENSENTYSFVADFVFNAFAVRAPPFNTSIV